jgi:hypothetical protein
LFVCRLPSTHQTPQCCRCTRLRSTSLAINRSTPIAHHLTPGLRLHPPSSERRISNF